LLLRSFWVFYEHATTESCVGVFCAFSCAASETDYYSIDNELVSTNLAGSMHLPFLDSNAAMVSA
jgi:hypothetical protein